MLEDGAHLLDQRAIHDVGCADLACYSAHASSLVVPSEPRRYLRSRVAAVSQR
jgi:hypothetical protein